MLRKSIIYCMSANKVYTILAVALVLTMTLPLMAECQSDADAGSHETERVTMTVHTYQNNHPETDAVQAETIESATSIGDKDVLYLSIADLRSNERSMEIKDAYERGVILISEYNTLADNKNLFGNFSLSDTADLCGIYTDPNSNVVSCYGVECDDMDVSYQKMGQWIEDIETNSILDDEGIPNYSKAVVSEHDKQCGGRGWMNIQTVYYLLEQNVDDYDYWVAKYYIESVPTSGNHTTKLKVETDFSNSDKIDGHLLRHGPNTTSGSSSASVGLSFDPLPSFSIGWEYSTTDVNVINNSNIATDYFSITHTIDRDSSASTNTFFCEPGALMKCKIGDHEYSYYNIDIYSVTFDYKKNILQWDSETYEVKLSPFLYGGL